MTKQNASFRDALGRFATGIVVVTGIMPDGEPVGITVNSFSSLSLDPPLVLFCLGKQTGKQAAFIQGNRFAVNVLGESQVELSNLFARSQGQPFAETPHRLNADNCGLLEGALARLHCKKIDVHDNGDHYIVIGEVTEIEMDEDGDPLLFFKGKYRKIGATIV